MNKYVVYVHINPINQKQYFGITNKENINDRWQNGFGYQYNKNFFYDIVQYGWNNFEHKILYNNLSKEKAEYKERELIDCNHTQDFKYGYNQTGGGAGSLNVKVSEITKEKHRQNWLGSKNPNAKKVQCVETNLIYDCCADAGEQNGYTRKQGSELISRAARYGGTALGLHWRYINE